eukprot:s3972_g3.t1
MWVLDQSFECSDGKGDVGSDIFLRPFFICMNSELIVLGCGQGQWAVRPGVVSGAKTAEIGAGIGMWKDTPWHLQKLRQDFSLSIGSVHDKAAEALQRAEMQGFSLQAKFQLQLDKAGSSTEASMNFEFQLVPQKLLVSMRTYFHTLTYAGVVWIVIEQLHSHQKVEHEGALSMYFFVQICSVSL